MWVLYVSLWQFIKCIHLEGRVLDMGFYLLTEDELYNLMCDVMNIN